MSKRLLLFAAMGAGLLFAFGPLAGVADACPMCKDALETDNTLPRAYMISILFMLAVPATVLTGFGIGFYRLSKQQDASMDASHLYHHLPPSSFPADPLDDEPNETEGHSND